MQGGSHLRTVCCAWFSSSGHGGDSVLFQPFEDIVMIKLTGTVCALAICVLCQPFEDIVMFMLIGIVCGLAICVLFQPFEDIVYCFSHLRTL